MNLIDADPVALLVDSYRNRIARGEKADYLDTIVAELTHALEEGRQNGQMAYPVDRTLVLPSHGMTFAQIEAWAMETTVRIAGGPWAAAKILAIDWHTVVQRLKRYGIPYEKAPRSGVSA